MQSLNRMSKLSHQALNHLNPGESATIHSISADETLFHRLAALGFRVGKRIELVRCASFNGPLHVRIGNTEIMLRRSQAALIKVEQL